MGRSYYQRAFCWICFNDNSACFTKYTKQIENFYNRILKNDFLQASWENNNFYLSSLQMAEDNVDIAASIKALARSVHGDTVFGDLPRPQVQRFSTQI